MTKLLDFGLVKTLQRRRSDPALAGGHGRRLAAVHRPRAGHAQPASRPARRHLLAGRGRLFPPDRPPAVPGRERDGGHDRAHPGPGDRRRQQVRARGPRRPGAGRAAVPGQEARRSISPTRRASPRRWPPAPTPRTGRPGTPPTGGRPTRAIPIANPRPESEIRREPTSRAPSAVSKPTSRAPTRRLESAETAAPDVTPRIRRGTPPQPHDRGDATNSNLSRAEMTSVPASPGLTEPLDATVHLAFAFDIGDEIDLDRAPADPPGGAGPVAAAAADARIDRLPAGPDPGGGRPGRGPAAGRTGR